MKGMTLALMLGLAGALPCGASEVFVEGAETAIPPLTEEVTALHLRTVGLTRVLAVKVPRTVTELSLIDNGLIGLPPGFIPSGIKRLWLADNALTALPSEAAAWAHLDYLNLDRNRLETLPDLSATRLRWLRANANALTALPPLPATLERLYLADNKLTAAPAKPAALKQLTLAGNPLAAIPADLGAGLEWLDLSRTPLTALPADLTPWRTLKVLNLARCPLPEAEKDRISAAFDPAHTTVIFQ